MGRDTNFAYSFLALPKDRRDAITAVWDFCRAVDDEVDEHEERPVEARRAGLDGWRREVAACFDNGRPATPQGQALQAVLTRFPLPRLPLEQLIDGCEMDLDATRFANFCELRSYCYKVASTVGLVCIEIFGYENPGTRDYAVELGLALQLTNILRDVGGDLARGRLYIPLDELEAHGVTEDMLKTGRMTPAVSALLERQAQRAREQFLRADGCLPPEDARRLVAARIMGAIYRDLLARIAARDYDVFSERVRVPRFRKARLAIATWMRTMAFSPAAAALRPVK
ncbi:MAG TPA: presqualene diphosphate synthase HpnD [Luteitalea sp.]|nr:presqualene diphosphate synthase HpnD [Luteitalea sp.]